MYGAMNQCTQSQIVLFCRFALHIMLRSAIRLHPNVLLS